MKGVIAGASTSTIVGMGVGVEGKDLTGSDFPAHSDLKDRKGRARYGDLERGGFEHTSSEA